MLLFRKVKQQRWNGADLRDPKGRNTASQDLEQEGTSVFQVQDQADAEKLAVIHAICTQQSPDNVDGLLFSDECLIAAGIEIRKTPDSNLLEWLSARHYEIVGSAALGGALRLVELIDNAQFKTFRVSKARVKELSHQYLASYPDLIDFATPRWKTFLTDASGV